MNGPWKIRGSLSFTAFCGRVCAASELLASGASSCRAEHAGGLRGHQTPGKGAEGERGGHGYKFKVFFWFV